MNSPFVVLLHPDLRIQITTPDEAAINGAVAYLTVEQARGLAGALMSRANAIEASSAVTRSTSTHQRQERAAIRN